EQASADASTPPGTPVVDAPVVSGTTDFGRATQLRISWGAVPANARGATVTYDYEVTSRAGSASGTTTGTSEPVDVSGWRFPVTGTDVTVTVRARTTVSGQTLQGVAGSRTAPVGRWGSPPSAPGAPSFVVDGDVLTATWSAPGVTGGSDVERYLLTWSVAGRPDVTRETDAATLRDSFDLRDVAPGSDVTLTVRARNASGTGDPATGVHRVPASPGGGGG
ncbi:fibronectin type III domain-containing protein, partial [Cellulomonas phragmiteti]